jgi:predicted nucleic acid-binding protein
LGLISLDSCLVIQAVEDDPVLGDRILRAMSAEADVRCAVSPLVKPECLVKPMRTGDILLQQRYEGALEQLVTQPATEPTCLAAARLRARFGLKAPDAIHLACTQHHGCEALWTNDDRLARTGHGLARNVLAGTSGSAAATSRSRRCVKPP